MFIHKYTSCIYTRYNDHHDEKTDTTTVSESDKIKSAAFAVLPAVASVLQAQRTSTRGSHSTNSGIVLPAGATEACVPVLSVIPLILLSLVYLLLLQSCPRIQRIITHL